MASEGAGGDWPVRVVLKARRARPFYARHPWVFAGSIERVVGIPDAGVEVVVTTAEGQFVARGLFNPRSAIRVRLYRWDDVPLDDAFWRSRIDDALALRNRLPGLDESGGAARLVFSESDGLSGLTVDRYDRWLSVLFTSQALATRRSAILGWLLEQTGAEGIWLRSERGVGELEGLEPLDGPGPGDLPDGSIVVAEHGLRYEVDFRSGQKTGMYLDQRDNRLAAAAYARGRRVLDLFCYGGGFALAALKHGGAVAALGIDSSAGAVELAARNAATNGLAEARFEAADVFTALERLRASGERFGLVVCDPPKFARSQAGLDEALKGYLRLNRAALEVLEPGGILVTCSCSGLVDRPMFNDLLGRVAELSGRPIQILEQRGQAPDHPVAASCLETEYLKCQICRVG